MRERPILFNTEMVRSILDGRKTCTRRVIKFPDGMTGHPIGKAGDSSNPLGVMYPGGIKRPPYQPGDILYVRETFTWCPCWDCGLDTTPDGCKNPVIYDFKKKEAARIFLKVTDVRVERLQEIDIEGIRNEGLSSAAVHCGDMEIALKEWEILWDSTIKKSDLDRYGWNANPYVWVIEFERCEKPPECILKGYDKAPGDGLKCLGYMYDDNRDELLPMCEKCSYQESYEESEEEK